MERTPTLDQVTRIGSDLGSTGVILTLSVSAGVALVGVAIVLTSLVRGRRARTPVWALAILLPTGVAVSRLYRGMHFPTDVTASVLLSIAALLCALLAVRSMAAAATERDRRAVAPLAADSAPEVAS
jgi:membrane-associated phospholipid phosphatase